MDCPKFRLDPDSFPEEAHTISSTNGSLVITSNKKQYSNEQYCIEQIKNTSGIDQKVILKCFSKIFGYINAIYKLKISFCGCKDWS